MLPVGKQTIYENAKMRRLREWAVLSAAGYNERADEDRVFLLLPVVREQEEPAANNGLKLFLS